MGKLANLINEKLDRVIAEDAWETEPGKPVKTEKDRQDVIDRLAGSAKSMTVYANKEFSTWFVDESITVKKGANVVPPKFGIHLLLKYAPNNKYGLLAQMNDTWVSDEPFEKVKAKKESDAE